MKILLDDIQWPDEVQAERGASPDGSPTPVVHTAAPEPAVVGALAAGDSTHDSAPAPTSTIEDKVAFAVRAKKIFIHSAKVLPSKIREAIERGLELSIATMARDASETQVPSQDQGIRSETHEHRLVEIR
jgi:hypothetical protein